jgi:predicted AlkP superfamily phosphohydrolase/phosphomutase
MKKPELLVLGIDGASPGYIREQVAQGNLPNFARLMQRGVLFEDCMTVFPSISPTCWTSVCTGALPSVHGALCQSVHLTGTHPFDFVTPYNSRNIHAQRFWETAAEIGKRSLIVNVCSSGPAKHENVLQIMGGTSIDPDTNVENSRKYGFPAQIFRNDGAKVAADLEKAAGGGEYALVTADQNCTVLAAGQYRFRPVFADAHYQQEVEPIDWIVTVAPDGVRVGCTPEASAQAPVLAVGEWSPVITRDLTVAGGARLPFQFRARLDAFDPETGLFSLFVSASLNFATEIEHPALRMDVAEIPEIASSDYGAFHEHPARLTPYFEGEALVLDWHRQLLTKCVAKYAPDIVFDYYGNIDTLNHRFRGAYEGVRSLYDGEHEQAVEAYRRGYELVDAHIGWLLDHMTDENTTVALISDHGSVGHAEARVQWRLLENAGLMTYFPGDPGRTWRNKNVDWSRTKAYPWGSGFVNVNLKGREPTGIVEPEDYDKVVKEIIHALQMGMRSRDGEIIALGFAVEKNQAGFVGQGSEHCGDVVYGLVGSRVGGYYGGVHAQQLPSARSKTGDIRALCLLSGPAFREDVILSRPTDLTDFAPTLCYAMGYPQPAEATGGVVFQALRTKK